MKIEKKEFPKRLNQNKIKKSSIEWFFEQLEFNEDVSRYEILEQAQELHKQEIIEAREDGFDSTYAD